MSSPKDYSVSGERVMFDDDAKPTDQTLPSRIRFESLEVVDAENFATVVYKREGIVCEIHEVTR